MGKFEYVVRVEGKEVWRGFNPKQKFEEIKRDNPGKKISVAWKIKEDVLVVCLR